MSFTTSIRLHESVLMTQAQTLPYPCRIAGMRCIKHAIHRTMFSRPYLKYHRRSNNRVSSMDSDPSRPASQPDVSKSNLQICTSKEDGGSFSFSDLDPVQEDTEGQEEPEEKK